MLVLFPKRKFTKKITEIVSFTDENDIIQQDIECNYKQIKADVKNIIQSEKHRIENDNNLKHLIKG